jgi:copper transport protein
VLPFTGVEGSLVEKSKGIGPIRFSFAATGPGHGTAQTVVPTAGQWTLTVQVKTDAATAYAGSLLYPVAP